MPTNLNSNNTKIIYKELSYEVVGILFEVFNELGYGYKEKYYQRAIAYLLKEKNISFKEQLMYRVNFKGKNIGNQFLDFLIDDKIILEIKKGNYFSRHNIEQVKQYLQVTNKKLAILANFTERGVKTMRILNINQTIE